MEEEVKILDLEDEEEDDGESILLSVEETELLYSIDPFGIRVFRIANANTNIVSVLLREEEDSFLVALPARLDQKEGGSMSMVSVIPKGAAITRLFKSNLISITHIYEPLDEFYWTYLREVAPKEYPDLVTEMGLNEDLPKETEMVERKLEEAILSGSFIGNLSDTLH